MKVRLRIRKGSVAANLLAGFLAPARLPERIVAPVTPTRETPPPAARTAVSPLRSRHTFPVQWATSVYRFETAAELEPVAPVRVPAGQPLTGRMAPVLVWLSAMLSTCLCLAFAMIASLDRPQPQASPGNADGYVTTEVVMQPRGAAYELPPSEDDAADPYQPDPDLAVTAKAAAPAGADPEVIVAAVPANRSSR